MVSKRDATKLQQLIDKYGDFKAFELQERLRNPRPGAPQKRELDARIKIFLDVEALKAAGLKTTEAWGACAKYLKISENIVQKIHSKGTRDFGPLQ